MIIEYEEIKQTSMAKAHNTYNFIYNDFQNGLEYPVAAKLYNESMKAVGINLSTTKNVSAEKFLVDFYNNIPKGGKK